VLRAVVLTVKSTLAFARSVAELWVVRRIAMTHSKKTLIAAPALLLITALLYFTRLGSNLLCYVTFGDYYTVPDQSSMFTFRPIEWFKEGSGEWWTYGEDNNNFYFWEPDQKGQIRSISKRDAATIPHFSSTDFKTWRQ
jgi:hypothetical protein